MCRNLRLSFLLVTCILFFVSMSTFAQESRCLTTEWHAYKCLHEPGYKERFESAIIKSGQSFQFASVDSIVIIPVVVHVISYNGTGKVSDEQIQSQIDVLNEDYAVLNATSLDIPNVWQGLTKDSYLRFTLAQRDPAGNATTGIVHSEGKKASYDIFDPSIYESDSGGQDAWPRNQYLNLWVCPLNGNALGYANYPGSAASNDGVVISPRAFGRLGSSVEPYNYGRTASHEVGHWMSLNHIWGDDPASNPCTGKDFTNQEINFGWDDTPNQAQPTFRCKVFPALDDCATASPGYMYMNYMDYTDDKCMMFFTAGQIKKVRSVINGLRDSLKYTTGHILPAPYAFDIALDSVISPVRLANTRCFIPQVRIKNNGADTVNTVQIRYGLYGNLQKSFTWTGALAPMDTVTIALPEIGAGDGNNVMEFRIADKDSNTVNNYRSSGFKVNGLTTEDCESAGIIAYPNPLVQSNTICIKAKKDVSQMAFVGLYNLLGQKIAEIETMVNPGDAISIPLINQAAGIYIARISGDLYDESVKFIYLPGENTVNGASTCN